MENKKIIEFIMSDKEYMQIIDPIFNHDEFQRRKTFKHHGETNVFDHSLIVSYHSYVVARKMGLDYKSTAIGGLLHDFYYQDWHIKVKRPFWKMHGFVHAKEAYLNSIKYFSYLNNKKIKDIITKHMFPLTLLPPVYTESWIICVVDKIVSMEILKNPTKLPSYIGINVGDLNE